MMFSRQAAFPVYPPELQIGSEIPWTALGIPRIAIGIAVRYWIVDWYKPAKRAGLTRPSDGG